MANDKAFISQLEELVATVVQDRRSVSGSESQSPGRPSRDFLATTSETLFRRCDNLLGYYNSTAQAISAIEGPQKPESEVQQGWQRDREKVERLLGLGKRVAGRRVEEVVRNKPVEDLVGDEEMTEAKSVFRGTEGREQRQGPGEVLQETEKGVKRMVRTLPKDSA